MPCRVVSWICIDFNFNLAIGLLSETSEKSELLQNISTFLESHSFSLPNASSQKLQPLSPTNSESVECSGKTAVRARPRHRGRQQGLGWLCLSADTGQEDH